MKIPTVGERVWDLAAIKNDWPDEQGEIIKIDGSNFRVKYDSGEIRWKAAWDLQLIREESNNDSL